MLYPVELRGLILSDVLSDSYYSADKDIPTYNRSFTKLHEQDRKVC